MNRDQTAPLGEIVHSARQTRPRGLFMFLVTILGFWLAICLVTLWRSLAGQPDERVYLPLVAAALFLLGLIPAWLLAWYCLGATTLQIAEEKLSIVKRLCAIGVTRSIERRAIVKVIIARDDIVTGEGPDSFGERYALLVFTDFPVRILAAQSFDNVTTLGGRIAQWANVPCETSRKERIASRTLLHPWV